MTQGMSEDSNTMTEITIDSGRTFRAKDNHRLHRVWSHMIERCHNPNNRAYQRYGGRGIKVCDEWRNDFQAFCKWARENGYDPCIERNECTIDRIDNSEGYSPSNCQWVSMKEQARNRRNNRVLTYRGKTMVLTDWAKLKGIPKSTLSKRLDMGWSVKDALTKPIQKHKSSRYRNEAI